MLLVFIATRSPGPGLDPDAMAYIGAARSLAHNGTLRVPTGDWWRADSTSALSYWPPGYPAAIAVPIAAGMPAIQGGRLVNLVAAGATAATLYALVTAAVGAPAGLLAVLVVFATPAVFDVHLSVLSEPLCLALLALSIAAMVYARDRLWLLSLLATAAVMVRYAGACAPAAMVTWTLFDTRFTIGRRVRRAIAVALLPTIALVAWLTRTALAHDRHGTPVFSLYGHWDVTAQQSAETVTQWLAPLVPDKRVQIILASIGGVVLCVLLLATLRDTAASRLRRRPAERVAFVVGATLVMAAWYIAVICAARLFVGGTIPFDWRILAPLIMLLEISIVVSAAHWWRAYHRPVHIVMGAIALLWIGAAATVTANDAISAATDGSDFAAAEWRNSPVLHWVREHGAGHTLYSNWPPAVYFHVHRIARELPDSTEVRHDLADFDDALRASRGLIVGFNEPSPDVVAPDSLAKLLRLHAVARFDDGTIWAP